MMRKFIDNIKFWFNNSRPYTIPITLLSWLVIFVYSLKSGGKILPGVLAYFGIALVHLATNLSDDYFDYRRLCASDKFMKSAKECKCKYLKEGKATIDDLRNVIIILLGISAFIGFILLLMSGFNVVWLAFIGLLIAVFYSYFSSRGFGDLAVIVAYGPLMYEGVYYVMTKHFSWDVLFLSLGCAFFVNSILYAHMLMDYDEDVISYKVTLCTKSGSKNNALNILLLFYSVGYVFMGILGFKSHNYLFFATYITIPLVADLYNSLKLYNMDKIAVPQAHFWHYPLDNWKERKLNPNAPFFFRFLFARNISTLFMLLACIAIIFS